MPKKNKPKIPSELKDFAKFLESRGYTLAIPFDNVREPGYIGTFNDSGQEVVVDKGKCLSGFVTPETGGAALGNYTKSSTFSLSGFLKVFGDIFGLNFDFLRVKSVSISFPKNITKTDFITLMDIEEDWAKISPACTKRIADPNNFLIVQVLVTDSLVYSYETKAKLTADAKLDLQSKVDAAAKTGQYQAKVGFESDTKFNIEVKDTPLTVGYKTATVKIQPQ
jgi:hypothetical protein